MKKECIECSEEFIGRADKKFCSDYCRSTYNNKLKGGTSNAMRNVNNILRRNRGILELLNPSGKTKVHRTKLAKQGFSFDFFTNISTTKKGAQYYFVYEQGYLLLEDDFVLLVRKD